MQHKSLTRILMVPTSTPNAATTMEFGNLPIRTLAHRRQLAFYHRLKKHPEESLAGQILAVQEAILYNSHLKDHLRTCWAIIGFGHYCHHNHHHLSLLSSQLSPRSVTIIITTITTICHYCHHNYHHDLSLLSSQLSLRSVNCVWRNGCSSG